MRLTQPAGVACAAHRRRHVLVPVPHRQVARRIVWIVRPGEADHQRPWGLAYCTPLDEPARLASREAVAGVLPRNLGRRRPARAQVAAVLRPAQLGQTVGFQVARVVVADQRPELVLAGHALPEAVRGVPRIEVHLADRGRVVAGLGQQLRPRANAGVAVVGPERVQVVRHAGARGAHAGQQRGPRRHAQRGGGIGPLVADAGRGDAVDVRGIDERRRRSSSGSRRGADRSG